jgi:YfiH family protein
MSELPFIKQDGFGNADVRHGFFGRRGGASKGLYDSLNCGLGSKDEAADVRENRSRAAAAFGLTPHDLITAHQVHSDRCIIVGQPWAEEARPEVDAMVTDTPGIMLGVLTADCAPVLFSALNRDGLPVIGAAHAGWGGALRGVLENTQAALHSLGAIDIHACIGPCIQQASYEVTEEFREPFLKENPRSDQFFIAGKKAGHLMFDLPGYIGWRLERVNVTVTRIAADTYAGEGDYFSFRRATHKSEPDYGRQLSAICITPAE